jgi:hypothetical protein
MSYKNFFFLLSFLFATTLFAHANDIYIAQNAAGGNSGAGCGNAHSVVWLNSGSNWGTGAAQVGPGDTVHLCGVISSPITVQASGTSSAPITIFFESGASMQSPVWSTPAITFNGQSWIIVDGGANGRIFDTNSGTGKNTQDSVCFRTDSNAANVTIQNIECGPLYVRTSSGDSNQVASGVSSVSGPNLTIRNSKFHDAYYCIDTGGPNASGLNIYNNDVYNCSTGIVLGDGGSGTTISNARIHGNHIHDGANWDGCWSGCSVWNHNDGIHVWTSSGGKQNAPQVYDNTIDGSWGAHTTAFIFMEADQGPMPSPMVYNNVLNNTGPNSPTNGLVEMKENITSGQLYNNTFDCGSAGFNAIHWELGSASKALNNVFLNCGSAFANDDGSGSMSHDYTAYWNTPIGSDAHIVTANPLLSAILAPILGSPLATAGENLTSYFSTDLTGATRPASGSWTLGAYQATGTTTTSYTLNVGTSGSGSGTVTSSPNGISCGTTCSTTYATGTSVTLTATAGNNSTFAGWSGSCSGTGRCTIDMTSNASVSATFNQTSSGGSGSGGSSGGGSSSGGSSGSGSGNNQPGWVQGKPCVSNSASSVSCAFSSPVAAHDLIVVGLSWTGSGAPTVSDSLHSTFSQAVSRRWNNGDATSSIFYAVVPAAGSDTLNVSFGGTVSYPTVYIHEYKGISPNSPLDGATGSTGVASASPVSGNTNASSAGELLFAYGDSADYNMTAGSGYAPRLTSSLSAASQDAIASRSGTYGATFGLGGNTSWVALLASFKPATTNPTLTVNKAGSGSGTVTSVPAGISCGSKCSAVFASGTKVVLTANPASGSTFSGWSGACSGTSACTVTLSSAASVTATFTPVSSAKIAFVQAQSCVAGSGSSLTCTFPGNVASGDLLVIGMSWSGSSSVSISDSLGAGWKQAVSKVWNGSASTSRIYYAVAPKAGADTVKLTFNGTADYPILYIHEYHGENTSAPLDVVSSSAGNSSGSFNSGAAKLTAPYDLVFGYADAAVNQVGAGSGYRQRGSSGFSAISEDALAAYAVNTSATFTDPGVDSWVALMAAFKAK